MNYMKDIPPEVLAKAEREFVEIFGIRVMRIKHETGVATCNPHGVTCPFNMRFGVSCAGGCDSFTSWITEEQLPKLLATRLTE